MVTIRALNIPASALATQHYGNSAMFRYQQDAADFSESRNTTAAEIVGVEAIMQQQALVQEATSFTMSNSRVASIVRTLPLTPSPDNLLCIMVVLLRCSGMCCHMAGKLQCLIVNIRAIPQSSCALQDTRGMHAGAAWRAQSSGSTRL